MTNVIVATKRPIQIASGGTAGLVQTTSQVTIKNTQASLSMEQLNNVVSTEETTGSMLVYDSDIKKWITKRIQFEDLAGNLDGGSF